MDSTVVVKDNGDLKELVDQGRDYLLSHGLMLRTEDRKLDYHAPFTLFPSPFPRHCYDTAIKVQTIFNKLMHKVAHDHDFLAQCLKSTIEVDEFTRDLWNIYIKAREEGVHQTYSLAMNRSDYMTTRYTGEDGQEKSGLKQVEFNTMASGAGSLSQRLCKFHKYILNSIGEHDKSQKVASNNASDGLADSVVKAWELYHQPKSVVLFLVMAIETNLYDQRLLEYSIRERDVKCHVIRRTLQDLQERGRLGNNNELLIDGFEIAVVYQRSCYHPSHYRGAQDWDARLMIEKSKAIKCPSLHYHLAGTKKVQQVLAEPGVLEEFLTDKEEIDLVRLTQTGLYSLNLDQDGNTNAKMGINDPCKYVLKPQREGGGNNVFDNDIAVKLKELGATEERTAFILMERIHPLRFHNYIVKYGSGVELQELISEIGVFGSLIGNSEEIIHNEVHGYLFRTKTIGTNEGGLMSGTAALDSVYLV